MARMMVPMIRTPRPRGRGRAIQTAKRTASTSAAAMVLLRALGSSVSAFAMGKPQTGHMPALSETSLWHSGHVIKVMNLLWLVKRSIHATRENAELQPA